MKYLLHSCTDEGGELSSGIPAKMHLTAHQLDFHPFTMPYIFKIVNDLPGES